MQNFRLPPLLPQLLLSIAEPVLNKIVSLDPDAAERLQQLQGRQLAVELTDLQLRLVLTVQPNGIWLNQHQEKVDCALITNLQSLRQLTDPSQLTRLIRENALDIEGDLQLLQQFNQFFARLNPAWAEHLSGYIGDAAAHKVSLLLQQAQLLLRTKLAEADLVVTELAQDELQLSPHPSELQHFSQQVHQLAARTEQLARQLALIKGK
ncbi:SCP2 domain-containing protein [Rheinheimera sp.]|uniref:ubiquinone biosynthesis accessory factor UbiJ n=1 Tax=Rheinheimera sp. TaxID=1869214 RepID=UPI0027B8D634|nr:SCP2 sterol-binding domain-containing protein [Rheinheimera sp.]